MIGEKYWTSQPINYSICFMLIVDKCIVWLMDWSVDGSEKKRWSGEQGKTERQESHEAEEGKWHSTG